MGKHKVRPKLPAAEALSHVLYEISMMLHCFLMKRGTPLENNVKMECFLIHARCLDEFFSAEKRGDDITCKYFSFSRAGELYPEGQRIAFNRINKEIAHLTHSRKSAAPDKEWVLAAELEKLRPVCVGFLEHVRSKPEWMLFGENADGCSLLLDAFKLRDQEAWLMIDPLSVPMASSPVVTRSSFTLQGRVIDHTDGGS